MISCSEKLNCWKQATGLAAPALAFLAMLRGSDGDPPTEVRQHFVQPTLRRVAWE